MEPKEGLHLPDDFAARAEGIKHLVEEGPEQTPHRVDALAAIGVVIGLGQEPEGEELAEELFEVAEAVLAQALDAWAQGGEPGAERGKERSVHGQVIILDIA